MSYFKQTVGPVLVQRKTGRLHEKRRLRSSRAAWNWVFGFWYTVVLHLQSIQHRAWCKDNRSWRTTSPRHEAWWWPLTHWVALKDRPLNEVGKYGNYGMQEEHNQSIKLPHTGWREEPGKAPQGVRRRKHYLRLQ